MGHPPSQKSIKARYGMPIHPVVVEHEVGHALVAEGKRCKRSTGHIAALILRYWYEDTYLPSLKEKKKKKKK